ncbi:hypothetical protein BGZ98_005904, partial [Dissophora globulifera]
MGVDYDRADKTRNYVDTPDIKMKRCRYLQERYSAKYKGVLLVWLDESYIHHHYVHNKFSDTMTVFRKNKSRCWCIIYAESEDGWVGSLWIWEAGTSSADHHENMNVSMFEKYMTTLCQWCKANYPEKKVVFCMDNAKFRRREYQANPAQHVDIEAEHIATIADYLRVKRDRRKGKLENKPDQISLLQLNKEDLPPKLLPLMNPPLTQLPTVDAVAGQPRKYKKSISYALARKPEHALPLATEVITE